MNTNRKVAEEESDTDKMIHHLHQQQYQSKNHVFLPKPITYLSESFGKFCTIIYAICHTLINFVRQYFST